MSHPFAYRIAPTACLCGWTLCLLSLFVDAGVIFAQDDTTPAPDAAAQTTDEPQDKDAASKDSEAETQDDGEDQAQDEPEDPETKLVSVSFSDMEVPQVAEFFMRELGKPVIIDDAVRGERISILAQDQLPRNEAFELIGNALRKKGVIMIEGKRQIDF